MENFFGLADIRNYIWILPVVFCIHEFEEWNILRWHKKYYTNLPESTNTSIRIHIVVLSIIAFLLTLIAYFPIVSRIIKAAKAQYGSRTINRSRSH